MAGPELRIVLIHRRTRLADLIGVLLLLWLARNLWMAFPWGVSFRRRSKSMKVR